MPTTVTINHLWGCCLYWSNIHLEKACYVCGNRREMPCSNTDTPDKGKTTLAVRRRSDVYFLCFFEELLALFG